MDSPFKYAHDTHGRKRRSRRPRNRRKSPRTAPKSAAELHRQPAERRRRAGQTPGYAKRKGVGDGSFGKLFDKKECAFCGEEIGLLGNRKLEDGNMCKNCAGKLSPWFDDRRHSTIAQIQEQLDYREANKEKVDAFRVTRTLGENTKVLLDENAGVFMVTSARNYRDTNPDVIKFSDVTGCNIDIDETRDEDEYRNSEGELVSYDPPRYRYYYNFFITIHVNNPYFDEIRFMLNSSRVEVREQMPQPRQGDIMGTIFNALGSMANTSTLNAEYETYYRMAQEIREALLQVRQTARDEAVAAAAPKAAVTCPWCGATTTPGANGCCEFCGGALN